MTTEIGMLMFPKLTQLDLTGPFEVLSRMPDARVHLIAKTLDPIEAEGGLRLMPSTTFADAPALDILFAPGGAGQIAFCDDADSIAYVRATKAKWITSACTGALILGVAGHLRGYRAATHWAFMELLPLVGATPINQRVVIDRDRITGGGVTAGIDIALAIVAQIHGKDVADLIAIQLEYGPLNQHLVTGVRAALEERYSEREAQLKRLRILD